MCIRDSHFDSKATQKVVFNKAQVEENIEAAIAQVQGADREVTGMVISTEVSSALASLKVNGVRQYPELSFGANPGDLNGLKMDINKTIKSNLSNDVGIVGDFENMFKWGYSKQIPFEIIKYGDPDNSGKDLKGYNQVYLRAEAYVGWGIMDGESFARLTTA